MRLNSSVREPALCTNVSYRNGNAINHIGVSVWLSTVPVIVMTAKEYA